MQPKRAILVMGLLCWCAGNGWAAPPASLVEAVGSRLPVYGHRNWIVVADSAYPAYAARGIETIYTGGTLLGALKTVFGAIDRAEHVRPVIYLDQELQFVDEQHAAGVEQFRKQLSKLLEGRQVKPVLHEKLVARLDEVGRKFQILILKTDLTIPYTSVFIELGPGYWSDEGEQALRARMRAER